MKTRTVFLATLALAAVALAGCRYRYHTYRDPYTGEVYYSRTPRATYVPSTSTTGSVTYYNGHYCTGYPTCPYCYPKKTYVPYRTYTGTTYYDGTRYYYYDDGRYYYYDAYGHRVYTTPAPRTYVYPRTHVVYDHKRPPRRPAPRVVIQPTYKPRDDDHDGDRPAIKIPLPPNPLKVIDKIIDPRK